MGHYEGHRVVIMTYLSKYVSNMLWILPPFEAFLGVKSSKGAISGPESFKKLEKYNISVCIKEDLDYLSKAENSTRFVP